METSLENMDFKKARHVLHQLKERFKINEKDEDTWVQTMSVNAF